MGRGKLQRQLAAPLMRHRDESEVRRFGPPLEQFRDSLGGVDLEPFIPIEPQFPRLLEEDRAKVAGDQR